MAIHSLLPPMPCIEHQPQMQCGVGSRAESLPCETQWEKMLKPALQSLRLATAAWIGGIPPLGQPRLGQRTTSIPPG